jgi:cytoskeleton protein RodZ
LIKKNRPYEREIERPVFCIRIGSMSDQTIGSILRQKREEKRLTLDQVFQAIKIRTIYLQAIENDQLDELPSIAQARGFIRLYASFLGIDPYVLLENTSVNKTEQETEPQSVEEPTITSGTTKTVKDHLTDLKQKSTSGLEEKIADGTRKVKDSFHQLIDKIPYRIVKKDQIDAAIQYEPKERSENQEIKAKQRTAGATYKAMSRAIGEDMQKAREALGLSLADVERQIRIREYYLFAIEQGNFDDLPSTVQGRGMIGNYAAFLNLNSETFLARFAEVLQQKRLENLPEAQAGIPLPQRPEKQKITGFKRLLSADLIFMGGIFLAIFVFIVWGAFQLLGVGGNGTTATVIPISDLLLSSGTPTPGENVSIETVVPTAIINNLSIFTPNASQEGTQTAANNDPIQLTIAANRRAYLKVTVDGKTVFLGRITPGTVYNYSGKTKINVVCGDASAIQIYYNKTYLGSLGITGQVVMMDFTSSEAIDLTANFTPTPTITQIATLTPNPTSAPTQMMETPTSIGEEQTVQETPTP